MNKVRFYIPKKGADLIRGRIKELGYSQDLFADEYLGVSDRTLRNWLSQKTKIDEANFENLLMEIGKGPKDIFEENLPLHYQDKSSLGRLVTTFRRLLSSGDIKKAIDKYGTYLRSLSEHVTFHRIPLRGPYYVFEHDGTHRHHYAHIEISTPQVYEQATYVLSFMFLSLVRVNIGHIVVTKDEITAKPFFQKFPYTILRDQNDLAHVHFAMWFANDPTTFFVESLDGLPFSAQLTEYMSEQEFDERKNRIVVFWKGVWH